MFKFQIATNITNRIAKYIRETQETPTEVMQVESLIVGLDSKILREAVIPFLIQKLNFIEYNDALNINIKIRRRLYKNLFSNNKNLVMSILSFVGKMELTEAIPYVHRLVRTSTEKEVCNLAMQTLEKLNLS